MICAGVACDPVACYTVSSQVEQNTFDKFLHLVLQLFSGVLHHELARQSRRTQVYQLTKQGVQLCKVCDSQHVMFAATGSITICSGKGTLV